jgi:hypothetical protein
MVARPTAYPPTPAPATRFPRWPATVLPGVRAGCNDRVGSARARRAVEAEVDRVPQRLQPDWLSQERGAGEHARSDQRLSRLP